MQHRILALAVVCVLISAPCLAQSSAGGGSIQGTVKDGTGAAIPTAKISILHLETGRATDTVANADGFFSTPPINIGKYKVRVEAAGMKAWEGEVALETGRIAELNPVLAPGQVTETVTVSSVLPLVTTTDPTDGSTLDSLRIKELPINGRDLNTLLGDVTPGVEPIIDVNGGIRTSGLMVYSTDFVQDGASANNREFGGSTGLQGLESIGEVRVETSTSSAKYTSATSVIVTTKSGGNQVRGALFETARNNAFGVARARQDVFYDGRPFPTPKLIRNEFGGSIGGPVYVPKLYRGRNRTFFFVSREGLELRQGLTRDFTVPTAAMRAGDFSGLIDGQGRRIQLYDPLTTRHTTIGTRNIAVRDPFINNQIPIGRISPLAKQIYAITPLPTDITNPLVTNNLKVVVPTNAYPNLSDNPTAIRIDHTVTKNDTIYLKTNWSTRSAYFLGTGTTTGAPTKNFESNVTYLPMQSLAAGINWTHIFSPRLNVETLANRTWQSTKTVTGPEDKNWAQELGLPNPLNEIGWPNITSVGFMNYTEGDNRRSLRSWIANAAQNYSLIQGTHTIQFGWSAHTEQQHLLPDQGAISGSAAFNSLATALESPSSGSNTSPATTPQTGYDAANFFLGYASSYTVGLKRGLMRVGEKSYSLYVQDSYRVSPRLTLTPGLRWDINPAFTERDNLLNAFDVNSHSLMFPEPLDYYYRLGATTPQVVSAYEKIDVKFSSAAELGKSKQIFPSNYYDFGPRAGFAYRLSNSDRKPIVIRGGYGLYVSALALRTLLANFSSLPPFRASFAYNPNSAAQSPDGITNYLLRNAPPVTAGLNSTNVVDLNNPADIGRGVSVLGLAPELPDTRIHEWNLTLEKQLSSSTVFRLRYNGKHGLHTDQLTEINPTQTDYVWYSTTGTALPAGTFSGVARRPYDQTAYTSVRLLQKTGYINTSTFTVEMERRFSKGLGFQAFYTVTNSLRMAGNSFRDDIGMVPAAYLPGAVPSDPDKLNRFLNYDRDIAIPKHRVRWNWNYDLPFGRGRTFARNAPGFLNGLIGGWKFSGSGTVVSTWFTLPTNNWGAFGKFEVYGKKYKILDCRGTPALATSAKDERCIEGYLYFNGYISQRNIDTRNAAGLRTGVFGLPADYQPAQKPINPWPKGGQPTDPGAADFDTNIVVIKLKSGANQRVTYDTGLHPWRNQYRLGPFNWTTDASLLKFFNLKEGLRLRVNVDLFNVLNTQGLNPPGSDGIASLANSYGGFGIRPRQMQLTMRLEW
jgi:hypothetical protein